jgi:HK97 family phage portal protein
MGWLNRAIRPPDETPNLNDPADVPPATVGPPTATPGDPDGLTFQGQSAPDIPPPTIRPSAWSGWPADWWPPNWSGRTQQLTDTAWTCVDLNASLLATMPPYLVNPARSLDASWMTNPDPDLYTGWPEFAKQLFWTYQLGETFILATAHYATGWPARFHVVPACYVNVEMDGGRRRYTIGSIDVTARILHIRYQGSVDDAHGHGPLETGAGKLIAGEVLARYAANLASAGGIPASVLEHPEQLTAGQATELRDQWVQARLSALGEPAVLSGGVTWKPTQMNPKDMALLELLTWNDSRIAVMLGVPPFLVGLPSGGDSMTYSNVTSLFDYHWRAGLRPKAEAVTAALSGWLLPAGTSVELNRDAYVQPEPLQRAQTAEILHRIVDTEGIPALSVEEIRAAERLNVAGPAGLAPAVAEVIPSE